MNRALAACLVTAVSAASHADSSEPPPWPLPQPRPITEVDVYRDMAAFWELAGKEQSLLVGPGVGFQHDSFATLDVAFRRKNFHGAWDLLPTTIASGVWRRDGHTQVPLVLGWQLQLGIFSSPYLVADAITAWTPAASKLEAGFEAGVGYEWRLGRSWAVDTDVRVLGLWPNNAMNETPWGVRATLSVRRYFGE